MALRPEPAGGRRVVTINVGGCRVRLAWAALARCPLAEEAAQARAGPPGSPGRRLRDLLDDPRPGPAGKLFACVSVAFVAATAVGLCLSTMPDIRAEEERGECSPKCRSLFVLETVCVAWFSFEFLLRSLRAESKCAFLRTPLNIIDILAILPFYVSLLAGLAAGGAGAGAGGATAVSRAQGTCCPGQGDNGPVALRSERLSARRLLRGTRHSLRAMPCSSVEPQEEAAELPLCPAEGKPRGSIQNTGSGGLGACPGLLGTAEMLM
ncbi:voltage-gated potassium channel regulatory subunit KCNG2 [Herpailurus yagouaroundi]|uniref:voltage-gated potassium channel regulatory subunit KCNG2 n=1 Tax=Herpailurus yagouaroundi TaxID=1608482 RepID=UPI001AD68B99|nr:potassium voltage-gated channel subfamily G member 2 [Puma yagouaroundi]